MPPASRASKRTADILSRLSRCRAKLIMLYETSTNDVFREIFHRWPPVAERSAARLEGYSVGKWEGDTMVVDTIGFNDRGWIDTEKGRPQTEALHVTERFRRLNVGHLELRIAIDDPKAYTKPWSAKPHSEPGFRTQS